MPDPEKNGPPPTSPASRAELEAHDDGNVSDARRGAGISDLRLLHGMARKLEHVRARLAEARASAASERAQARQASARMQDMQAQAFRLREQLVAAQLDADESYRRAVDLDAQLRSTQGRVAELQSLLHDVGEHLRQALATHANDNARWSAEVDRVRGLHEADLETLQRELERVRAAHEADNSIWQAEVDRLRGARAGSPVDPATRRGAQMPGSSTPRWRSVVDRLRRPNAAQPESNTPEMHGNGDAVARHDD